MIYTDSDYTCYESDNNLLYDFSLASGDTLSGCFFDPSGASVIDSTTQEMIWGENRQVFHVPEDYRKFIEGIGGTEGLFSTTYLYVLGCFPFMIDYCIEGDGSCEGLLVNNQEVQQDMEERVSVFPNPASQQLTIKIPDSHHALNASVEIYNTVGQLEWQEDLTASQTVIDVSSLAAGSYFYRFIQAGRRRPVTGQLQVVR